MIKKCIAIGLAAFILLFTAGCTAPKAPAVKSPDKPAVKTPGTVEITFPFIKQNGIANNQFAVWIEDSKGKFIKTLYVTRFTGEGGYKQRPEALPEWVKRSDIAAKGQADLMSGATPGTGEFKIAWDCTDGSGAAAAPGDYSFFIEGTIAWKDDLYKGVITVGEEKATGTAEAVTKASDNNDMIGKIQAVFIPAE